MIVLWVIVGIICWVIGVGITARFWDKYDEDNNKTLDINILDGLMDLQVIESHSLDKPVEWGISFTDHNPESEDYFKMPDKETAFRLKKKLEDME